MQSPSLGCAVITPVTAGADAAFAETAESVASAVARDRGAFEDVYHLRIDDPKNILGPAKTRIIGLEQARARGANWVFFADAGVRLMPDLFRLAAPALGAYDAVWGASCVIQKENGGAAIIRDSISAFSELAVLAHRLQSYWFGFPHFVRLNAAREIGFDARYGEQAGEINYLFAMWRRFRCLKTAQPFAAAPANWPPLDDAAKLALTESINTGDIMIEFDYRGTTVKLPFTGRNAIIENVQMRAQFFEQPALEYLASHLKPGAVVVDVGANTGNHAVFFSRFTGAAKLVLIEPNPEAIRALEVAVAANDLHNVDISLLAIGAGKAEGRFSVAAAPTTTLGATRLTADPDGPIQVKPLDGVLAGPIDLIKIDVEDMELEVLKGAHETIKRTRPLMYVEVMDKNIGPFLDWVAAMDYRIDRIFPEFTFANYVLVPKP